MLTMKPTCLWDWAFFGDWLDHENFVRRTHMMSTSVQINNSQKSTPPWPFY